MRGKMKNTINKSTPWHWLTSDYEEEKKEPEKIVEPKFKTLTSDDIIRVEAVIKSNEKLVKELQIRIVNDFDAEETPNFVMVDEYISSFDEGDSKFGLYLTNKEANILGYIAQGFDNKEIAKFLGISTQTVKNHVTNVSKKFGASGRQACVAVAIRRGLLVFKGAKVFVRWNGNPHKRLRRHNG